MGRGKFRLGVFDVYHVAFWTTGPTPGGSAGETTEAHRALVFDYLRRVDAETLVTTTVSEILRIRPSLADRSAAWNERLRAMIPGLQRGARLTAISPAGSGVTFHLDGRLLGALDDPEFGEAFFAIWLGETTRDPVLRGILLGAATGD